MCEGATSDPSSRRPRSASTRRSGFRPARGSSAAGSRAHVVRATRPGSGLRTRRVGWLRGLGALHRREHPDIAATGVAARSTPRPRAGRRQLQTRKLTEELAEIAAAPREGEHPRVHAEVPPGVRLTQYVRSLQMPPRPREITFALRYPGRGQLLAKRTTKSIVHPFPESPPRTRSHRRTARTSEEHEGPSALPPQRSLRC